jgi:NAD(P)-dependent dehydrogenase (short-subunit alcohol dehydrogenase family)
MSVTQFAQPNSFSDRTVIVTGGAGTIGRPLCLAFAAAGANVVVNDLGGHAAGGGKSSKAADEVAAEIQSLGGNAIADYSSVKNGTKIVAAAVNVFGTIDVIVNNAGIIRYKSIADHTMEDFRSLLKVNTLNTLGGISLTLVAWPYFRNQRYGRVVNFTSDSVFGMPMSASYIVSKSALIRSTKAFALEGAAFGILVNAVGPVAYSRMAGETIPDQAQREAFKAMYSGDGNVPMVIMALSHESNDISGKLFSLGAFNVSEMVLGFKMGFSEGRTMVDCLKNRDAILGVGEKVQEAENLDEVIAKRMGFVMAL